MCLTVSLLLAFPFLVQLPYVQTVDNVDYFTIEDHPDVAFYNTIKDTFGNDEFFLIAFSSPEMFTPPVLRMIATITKELKAIPEVEEVQSLANVDYIQGAEDYFGVRPFLERIPDDDRGLEVLRRQAVNNPLYVGNLISTDGNTTDYDHARILIRISEHNSAGQARIITALRTFIDQNGNNGLQIRVTGRAVQDVNTIDALVQGQINA